jgi:large subunit ribosomal protein L30
VPKKTGTIHIKWIRSGIGFSRKQKEVVRSIGLHRLNQVVERPDTTQFRGLVAKVCHLVEVVDPPAVPTWTQVPEYKITPAELKVAAPSLKKAVKKAAVETPAATEVKAVAPAKKAATAKSRAAKPSVKETAKGPEKAKPKRKAAAPKLAATAKKESKSKKGKK